jgi:virulence-associated protein VapD
MTQDTYPEEQVAEALRGVQSELAKRGFRNLAATLPIPLAEQVVAEMARLRKIEEAAGQFEWRKNAEGSWDFVASWDAIAELHDALDQSVSTGGGE